MSFPEKVFEIKGWNGTIHSLTAKQLYERVLEDSKSHYNWIASATELVRVCNEPSFPEGYAQNIKLLILDCFADLELRKEYLSYRKVTDNVAVYSCYHSLLSTSKSVAKVKEKYLTAIIAGVIKYSKDEIRFPIHIGPAYSNLCEEWKKVKYAEYSSKEKIDFAKLKEDLYADFDKTIKTAEENGLFSKDDEASRMAISKFVSSVNLKNVNFFST